MRVRDSIDEHHTAALLDAAALNQVVDHSHQHRHVRLPTLLFSRFINCLLQLRFVAIRHLTGHEVHVLIHVRGQQGDRTIDRCRLVIGDHYLRKYPGILRIDTNDDSLECDITQAISSLERVACFLLPLPKLTFL